jgi:cobalt-zinc-cadmium efflux system membrane fusion protein
MSCGENDSPLTEENPTSIDDDTPMSISGILEANPEVKIGVLPNVQVAQKVNCTGNIEIPPTELISVHSISPGFVEWMTYLPGDFVKKGALLFKITNTQLVEKQRLLLETKAQLAIAEKDYDRKQRLQSEKVTTEKALDESTARKELLTATYKGLRNELQLLGIDVDLLEEKQEFQSTLSLYSAKSGYVHKVSVNMGQMIEPQDQLMEIANNEHMHLELQVLSRHVPLLSIGQKIEFTLPNSRQKYLGEIVKLNPMLDPQTGTLNVHCHIENEVNYHMIAGTFVNAEINVEAINQVGLPLEAVIKSGSDYYAYIVEESTLRKVLLQNVSISGDIVTFDSVPAEQFVVAGAYYVE